MKVLLTGGTGLLGNSLLYFIPKSWDLTTAYHKVKPPYGSKSIQLDLSNKKQIADIIAGLKPELIIHAAAAKDIEWCESNVQKAFEINSEATQAIAETANETNSRIVYISTDFVFDGKKGNYSEGDKTNPINVYGQTKLDGEVAVLKNPDNVVIRTNFYGIEPSTKSQSFPEFIINSIKGKKEVAAAKDQFCNPIFADMLSDTIIKLCLLQNGGVFNVGCTDYLSRYDFALCVCDVFGLDKALVKKTTLNDLVKRFEWKAKRPKDTTLDVSGRGKTFKFPDAKSSLKQFKSKLMGE